MDNDSNLSNLLNHLWAGGKYAYYWTLPDRLSRWFEPLEIPIPPNGRRNVYFGVHPVAEIPATNARGDPRPAHYIRSQNDSITAVNTLFGEFDIKDFGSKEAIFTHLSGFPQATVTVFSGGGYHLYWLLDQTFLIATTEDRERIRTIQANWVDYTGSDKQSKDLARVLRLPGTRNYKEKYAPNFPSVEIVEADFYRLYALVDLEAMSRPPEVEIHEPLPLPAVKTNGNDLDFYRGHALNVAAKMIRDAPDGEKHCTLLKAARLLGGYVAGGIVDEIAAIGLLEYEIGRKPNVDSIEQARDTIRDGIEYGKAQPITLEQKVAERVILSQPNGNNHQKRPPFYNAKVLDQPEWMTVLVYGEAATSALKEANFCVVGLRQKFSRDMVQFFERCHKVFVALGPEYPEQAKSIAAILSQAGIETRLCHLPVQPDLFFTKYNGTSREMFNFLKFGTKVI